MKINKLRLKNLNSLKGAHEIDFAEGPLAENGIFAITGPTGAGKTTLLDAICLALYNQVPRTGSQKISKNHLIQSGGVCTRNTTDSYAEVEYSADGKTYRSHWSIRINKRGNLADYEMTLADVATEQFFDLKKSEVPKRNETLIGLGFEQFLKSSLLAQGEFAKFLKADKDERGKLLENITGTTIYREIGVAAFEKQKREKEKLDWLEKDIDQMDLLSEEQVLALKGETTSKETEKDANALQLKQLGETKKLYELILKGQRALTEKQQEAQEIEQDILAFRQEKNLLAQHQKVAAHQELIIQHENLSQDIAQLKHKMRRDTEQLATHEETTTRLTAEADQLAQTLTAKEEELTQLKPVWEQVKKWDIDIAEEGRVLDSERAAIEEINDKINKQDLALSRLLENKQVSVKAKADCEAYLSEKEGLSELPNALSGLEKQYTSASILTRDCSQVRDQLTFYDQDLSKVVKELKKPDEILNYIAQQLAGHQVSEDIHERVEAKREEIKQLQQTVDTHKELNRQALSIQSDQVALAQIKERIAEETSLIDDLKESVGKLLDREEIQKLAVDELEIRHQRQLLEAKYEEDRGALVEGQACPLCGSEEHPFVVAYTNQVSQTAEALKQAKRTYETIHNERIEQQAQAKATQEKLLEAQDKQKTYAEACQKALDELHTLCASIGVDSSIATLTATAFVTAAEEVLQAAEAELELWIKEQKIEQDYQVLGTLRAAAQKAKEAADLYKLEVAPYSAIVGSAGIDSLKEAAQVYERNRSRLQQVETELQTLENTETLTQQSLAEGKTAKRDKEESYTKRKTAWASKQKERSDTFGVKNPDEEQASLVQSVDVFKTQQSEANVEQARLSANIQTLKLAITGFEQESKEKQGQFDTSTLALSEIAKQLDLEAIEELRKCLLPADQVTEIEEKDRTLDRKRETVRADVLRIDQEIIAQKVELPDDYDDAVAKASLTALESQQEALIKRISEIEFTLKTNDEKGAEINKLRTQIEAQKTIFSKWKKLSELIGSADGKVFSIFAQNLTLQHLIFLANKHLSTLSDRYVLIKDANDDKKEDIYIRDQWQGDAERSVSTLSGGESFIVSLSLALGLSEMASKNVKIESLFIDEGFGTLDQNTLEMVLTVLEQLQYKSSCSIGIISHVEQLKERITTQIVLEPNASGHSTIEVMG